MTHEPLVSIITPAYNSAAYIGETIESALAQTCRDFEMLIVDDGSTDGTIDVVRAAAAGDPRVILLNAPHGGTAAARNVAIDAARGRFIALLDSDDVWAQNYLSEQLAMFDAHPGIAIVSANAFSRGGPLDGRPLWEATSGCHEVTLHEVVTNDRAVMVMAVIRREVLDRIGGFNPRLRANEDYELWIRAANAGFRILQNRRPLARYRRHAASVSADEIRMLHGMISVLESTSRLEGPIAREAGAIAGQVAYLREEVIRAQLRSSLSARDGRTAALGLKALSELRGSLGLAIAARVTMMWPELLLRAYGLRRALR
jgi:glycosyltransferase involved in cell wall biosynthesis